MKIFELAVKLKEIYDQHGDIEVFFAGPNMDSEPYCVERTEVVVAEEDEFPEDYNMPAGYKFVELLN
jgi:hypothetical protein